MSAELSSSKALEGRLQQRLASSVPAAQLDEMAAHLQVRRSRQAPARHQSTTLNRAEGAQGLAVQMFPLTQILGDTCRWLRRQLLMRRDRSLH